MDEQNQTQQRPQGQPVNALSIISYIGPLCFIPILIQEKDESVKFHARQGLVLFLGEVATWFLYIFPFFWAFLWIINLGWFALSIVGIMNAMKNERKPLPLLGGLAERLKF